MNIAAIRHYLAPFALSILVSLAANGDALPAAANHLIPATEMPQLLGMERLRLYQNRYGYILCENDQQATDMLTNMERAAADFLNYFGEDPAAQPGKGLYFRLGILPPGTEIKLMSALNASWMLPVFDADTFFGENAMKDIANNERKRVKKQSPNASEEEIESTVRKRVPMIAAMRKLEFLSSLDGANTHELGHMYLLNTYWSAWAMERIRKSTPPEFYGTPAADWLDEAAATLTEGPNLTQGRWNIMRNIVTDGMKGLLPLAELTTMKHPQKEADARSGAVAPAAGKVVVSNSVAVPGTEEFYAQCRAFAEFLIARSGKSTIMGSIARSEAGGRPFARWLADSGRSNNIPSDFSSLDSEYRSWITEKIK